MNTWIKRSERELTQADFPILGGAYVLGSNKAWDEDYCQHPLNVPSYFTHWRSIKCDPPPRELTQRERDEAEFILVSQMALANSPSTDKYVSTTAARLAVHRERREVAKLMASGLGLNWGIRDNCYNWAEYTVQLRARLDEQGAK